MKCIRKIKTEESLREVTSFSSNWDNEQWSKGILMSIYKKHTQSLLFDTTGIWRLLECTRSRDWNRQNAESESINQRTKVINLMAKAIHEDMDRIILDSMTQAITEPPLNASTSTFTIGKANGSNKILYRF